MGVIVSSTLPVPHASPMLAKRGITMPPAPKPRSMFSSVVMDRLFGWAARGAAWLTLALLFGILASLVVGAWPAIEQYGVSFLGRSVWDPVAEDFGGLV